MREELDIRVKEVLVGERQVFVAAPDERQVRQMFRNGKFKGQPYWTRIWPSALGLAQFIEQNPEFVRGLDLMELGAGLGLPSLVAARYARQVTATDLYPEAASLILQSAAFNGLTNIRSQAGDWLEVAALARQPLFLLSDVFYEPDKFDEVEKLIRILVARNARVLLSCPERLTSTRFLQRIEALSTRQQTQQLSDSKVLILELKST